MDNGCFVCGGGVFTSPTISVVLKVLEVTCCLEWMEQSDLQILRITLIHYKELKGWEGRCWGVYEEAGGGQEPGVWA